VTSTPRTRATGGLWRGLLLVSLAGVIWGTIGPGVHLVHERSALSPLTISAYRAVVAVAVLLTVSLLTGRLGVSWSLARPQWRRVVAVGLLTAAFQLLFFIAVVSTGVSLTTVVCLGFAPVLLLFVGSAQQRRLPSSARVLTVTMAVVGLLLVSLVGGGREHASNPTLGLLTALGSGAAYALSAEVAGPLSQRLDTLTITTATMSVAGAALVPGGLMLAYLRGEALTTADTSSWLLIVYLGVVTMAVAYALLFTGLRSTPSGAAVVATLLEPVTAVLIAVLFLGEQLTAAGVLGALLIVAAIGGLGRTEDKMQPPQ
jgi:DME family drug/metabolite transporter